MSTTATDYEAALDELVLHCILNADVIDLDVQPPDYDTNETMHGHNPSGGAAYTRSHRVLTGLTASVTLCCKLPPLPDGCELRNVVIHSTINPARKYSHLRFIAPGVETNISTAFDGYDDRLIAKLRSFIRGELESAIGFDELPLNVHTDQHQLVYRDGACWLQFDVMMQT